MKLSKQETRLRQSVERGEWKSSRSGTTTYATVAKATLRKNRRINIRINEADLEAIQKRALEEGIPYQSLVSSVLHKYATRRIG
jgi:predicted DNA binding CopG/RHH family protein